MARTLVADRFLPDGSAWLDTATGGRVGVRLRPMPGGDRRAWIERRALLVRLRHPALRTLVDFGAIGRGRIFDAWAVEASPVDATAVRHLRRFLAVHGLSPDDPDVRPLIRRPDGGRSGRAPIGLVLRPREALVAIVEALGPAAPAGVATCCVSGPPGAGLRTLALFAAREARLRGYVPLATHVAMAHPELRAVASTRHVALIHDMRGGHTSELLDVLARLAATPRRHLLIVFACAEDARKGEIAMDPLRTSALVDMVYRDRWTGPVPGVLRECARAAGGRPGRLLALLAGVDAARPVSTVREAAVEYRVVPTARAASPSSGRLARAALNAMARAERLVLAGRHAGAGRLLERAARVLERTGDAEMAARGAVAHGWLLRERGRIDRAAGRFNAARDMAAGTAAAVDALTGLGATLVDREQWTEAESTLRAAVVSADAMGDAARVAGAARGLARCLLWTGRPAEGLAELARVSAADDVATDAILARLHAAMGDAPRAISAAQAAWRRASERGDARLCAVAARAQMAARVVATDADGVAEAAARAVACAVRGHLPLYVLRVRIELVRAARRLRTTLPGAVHAAARLHRLEARTLPPLLRRTIGDALTAPVIDTGPLPVLRRMLDHVHTAQDDERALGAVAQDVLTSLRASAVAVVVDHGERAAAVAGRWPSGDWTAARRALMSPGFYLTPTEPRVCAVPVAFGGEVIGAVTCRWAAGTALHVPDVEATCEAAALAVAPVLRALSDRVPIVMDGAWQELLGGGEETARLRQTITAAAGAPFPVLIEGESGSGKEVVARAIHRLSNRRSRRLCALNCAALSDDLVEAELFGHTRGAFTGAVSDRAGLFEEADGGTLFLDEVGELSPRAQAKLLRALQDGEVRRVGDAFPRRVDARIVAATNRCLTSEVSAGRFRADLRFRLDVIRIVVPPLRERAADIPVLVQHFWADATTRVGSRATLAPDTVAALSRHDWPGNVRELQNAMAALAVHGPRRGRILPSMLPATLASGGTRGDLRFEAARAEFERRYVRAALARADGHQARAARALGVSRQGLAKMLRRLGIDARDVAPGRDTGAISGTADRR